MVADLKGMLTLQEVIDLVRYLGAGRPRVINPDAPLGLYLELKKTDLDMAGLVMEVLRKNELDTVASCELSIPIVLQSFELDVLEDLSDLTDLPLTYLIDARTDE